MTKICWHYDLIYFGGIEQSMASLLEILNDKDMFVAHRQQYYTQEPICDRIRKTSKLINTDEIDTMYNDITIFAGMIFDYKTVFEKIKSKKTIGWIHYIPGQQVIFEHMLLYPEYYKKIDYWVCVSEVSKRGLLSMIPDAKVRVIHNIIDENRVKRLSKVPININADKNTIKFVTSARLSKEKGILPGIEFIKQFHEANIPYIWYLIGGGSDPDMIDAVNEARKTYNIITPGFLENPYNVIAQCDYGLLLSENESWGIFLDECHILGVPTITTDFEAIRERKNIEKYGIILNHDLSNLDIKEIISKKDKLKANLKSYKYQNDLHLWYELLDDIKKEL